MVGWGLLLLGAVLLAWLALRRIFSLLERHAGADWGRPWVNRLDGLIRIYCRRFQRLRADPLPLPESGAAIVVANHISGLDPLLLVSASRRPLRFIIASEEYNRFGLRWLFRASGCIPVDRARNPQRAYRAALQALERGEVVALFPHGGIHLDSDPHRRLKPGAVRMAQLAGCPLLPVRIDGVRAAGDVFLPLLLRGHARLRVHPPIRCSDEENRQQCSQWIAERIGRQAGA